MKTTGMTLVMALSLAPVSAAAQSADGQWWLGLSLGRIGFSGASRDTTAVGVPLELRPGGRLNVTLGVAYSRGPWEGKLEASYAGGHVRLDGDAAAIEDKTIALRRIQLAQTVSRRLLSLGQNALLLRAGPTLDRWSGTNLQTQLRLGVQAGLALRIPAGGARIENTLSLGYSSSPFSAQDLPPPTELRRLWSLSAGMGIQLRL